MVYTLWYKGFLFFSKTSLPVTSYGRFSLSLGRERPLFLTDIAKKFALSFGHARKMQNYYYYYYYYALLIIVGLY